MTLPQPKEGSGLVAIVFDIDGTLAEATWPRPGLGAPIAKGIEALLDYFTQGYEIILHTSRPASHVPMIRDWLRAHGLANVVYDIVTGKPRGIAYIDDRAITFPEAFEDKVRREERPLLVTHALEGHYHTHVLPPGTYKPDHDHDIQTVPEFV